RPSVDLRTEIGVLAATQRAYAIFASLKIASPREGLSSNLCAAAPDRAVFPAPRSLLPAPSEARSLLPAPCSLSRALLALQRKAARTWQHVLPRRPASTAAPPAAPRSRSA